MPFRRFFVCHPDAEIDNTVYNRSDNEIKSEFRNEIESYHIAEHYGNKAVVSDRLSERGQIVEEEYR